MAKLVITDKDTCKTNIDYLYYALSDLIMQTESVMTEKHLGAREQLTVDCKEYYFDIIKGEALDKIADIIVVNYKYNYFKSNLTLNGLNDIEKELLLTSLISADLDDDKKFAVSKLKNFNELAVDGMYNFRLKPLKNKWKEITEYMPSYFAKYDLKEFISYLLEGKKKKVFIDGNRVYDANYRRLIRGVLMNENLEDGKIIREVLLSGSGEVELCGQLSPTDEYYLKEFYGDRVICVGGYSC